ncbi:MAG: DUF1572 family protein [Lewinellaceae bacterium]|nr:DUF1572 family protein [Lewinellaceae bacterium]
MLVPTLSELFRRDLQLLAEQIKLYPNESALWAVQGDISNAGGNLCLHLCGNLKHFIGAVLGQSGYIRDRPYEFAAKEVPREKLLADIEETIAIVSRTLAKLPESELEKDYPLEKRGEIVSTAHMLVHLYGHLSYHLGQVNYHRRLLN